MSQWLKLKPAVLNTERHQLIRGVQVNVFMSPHDVPGAVRGEFEKSLNRFVIEFKYIDEEPWNRVASDHNIALRVGRHSGRLHGIEIDAVGSQADKVQLRMHIVDMIKQALTGFAQHSGKNNRIANYQIAKDVISKEQDQIFAGMSPSSCALP